MKCSTRHSTIQSLLLAYTVVVPDICIKDLIKIRITILLVTTTLE